MDGNRLKKPKARPVGMAGGVAMGLMGSPQAIQRGRRPFKGAADPIDRWDMRNRLQAGELATGCTRGPQGAIGHTRGP